MRTTLPAIAASSLVLGGCVGSPTGPDPPELTHPAEMDMQGAINCAADALGTRELELWFWYDREWITLEDGRLAFVACRAGLQSRVVKCDHRWVLESAHLERVETAAHEVAHVAGDYEEPPLETMAQALAVCK
ncbi:hypothetical protein LCGC14_2519710 [marine sediment metagenome]|uniref:Lipoprotein n=1 Tax=marine sediment metagenome TaxID=412755 RepID=A0A0F9DQ16_9ZZZZ